MTFEDFQPLTLVDLWDWVWLLCWLWPKVIIFSRAYLAQFFWHRFWFCALFLYLKLINRLNDPFLIYFGTLLHTKSCKPCLMMMFSSSIFFKPSMYPLSSPSSLCWSLMQPFFDIFQTSSLSYVHDLHSVWSFWSLPRSFSGFLHGFFKTFVMVIFVVSSRNFSRH